MEKLQPPGHKSKSSNGGHQVLKFLKAASSINFNNPPFSPSRDNKPSSDNKLHNYPHPRSGFSGPLLPRVPRAVRGKFKSGDAQPDEPTSPTISCIGQIKSKSKKKTSVPNPKPDTKENKKKSTAKEKKRDKDDDPKKKHGAGSSSPGIWKIFGSGSFKLGPSSAPSRRKRSNSTSDAVAGLYVSDSGGTAAEQSMQDGAPGLSQMRRFASGHRPDGLGNFDWTAHQIAPVESECRDYNDDEEEERGRYSDDDTDEEEVIVPFSTRIADVEGMSLKPRKEVNLWKRRTLDPPRPLQLVGSSAVRPN